MVGLQGGAAFAQPSPSAHDGLPRLKLALALEQLHGRTDAGRLTPPSNSTHIVDSGPQGMLRMSNSLDMGRWAPDPAPSAAQARTDLPEPVESPTAPAPRHEQPAAPINRIEADAPSNRAQSRDAAMSDSPPASTEGDNATISAQVVGDAEFLPAEEWDAADLPSPPAQSPQEPTQRPDAKDRSDADAPRRRWGIPPIRWGGSLSVGLRRSTPDSGAASTNQVYTGQLRASSYLMKPYIALVSGDFALTSVRSETGGGDAASSNLVGTSITGTGGINIFPQSRFPFSASISLSDSRSESSFDDSNTQSTRLTLRQDYRPPVGEWNTSFGYDRSMLDGDFGSDTVDRLYGQFTTRRDRHTLNLSGDLTHSQWENGTFDAFYTSASHSVGYDSGLSITNFASLVKQRSQTQTDNATDVDSEVGSLQFYSAASWYPSDSKLRGAGTVRYFRVDSGVGGAATATQTFAADLNAAYQFNENFNLSGGIGFISDLEGDDRFQQNGSLSANYSGDPIRLGEFTYTWSTSASFGNNYGSDGESGQTLGASIGHSLSRYWTFDAGTMLNAQISQNFGSGRTFGGTSAVSPTTLSTNASLSLSANAGNSLNGYLSASISDSRTRGESESTFQMLNMQLSGNWRINGWSSLNSNLTWQFSRQESANNEPIAITDEFGRLILIDSTRRTENYSLSGNLGYHNGRFMGIRRLGYRADFRANTGGSRTSRRFGDPDGLRPEDEATLDFEQTLMYRIGRLDTELQHRVNEVQGRRNQSIYIRAIRSFGAF